MNQAADVPTLSTDSAFRVVSSTLVESLDIEVQQYEHVKTGAVHYHIASEHDEKVFLVALRTMPQDSTGVAHILEHTALCGSEKYPVRDPFFMMTRRSLNTFMNAMTSSDWTAYPFASQNDKDFQNLLDVYLDAVFFSRLDPLDFAQEGHRVEFDGDSEDAPLVYKGVVFNEMKGAMSSPVSQLWQGISSYLFPTTTYHYNSGGEPSHITDLDYQQLVKFYRQHYHPSNAIFMTFGNLDVNDLHHKIDQQALAKFDKQDKQWRVAPEKRYSAPLAVTANYGVDGEDLSNKTHHVVGWLLGQSTDLDSQLEAHLMCSVLLDNSASPLRRALEETKLGSAPSPLCGLEDSNREMSFMCGVEGSEPNAAEAVENLIIETLQQVAKEGVDSQMVESALHQLELHQREIGGDSYPYGLQLIFNALPAATHHGDPVALINLEPALERLRVKASKPDFTQAAVKRLLLNNRHRVRYTLQPDSALNEESKRLEEASLTDLKASLNDQQAQQIRQQAADLKDRQEQQDNEQILPQVTLADVKPELAYTQVSQQHACGDLQINEYQVGTNGLVYQQLLVDLPSLSQQQLEWLPLFTSCWSEVGANGQDYLYQQQVQTATVGSLGAYSSIKANIENANEILGYCVMSGKALANKAQAFTELMQQTWQSASFDETQRIADLINQSRARKEQGITGSGHSLAMALASAPLNHYAHFTNQSTGIANIQRLKQWSDRIQTGDVDFAVAALKDTYQAVLSTPDSVLTVHDETASASHLAAINDCWQSATSTTAQEGLLTWSGGDNANYWMVDSQVNFCAMAFPTVALVHADAAPLAVLGGVLRNGYLHGAIREKGGAYGAGATQDSASACFKFYSYRDPRVEGTFDDFEQSIDWLLDMKNGEHLVEQSVLGLIGSLDRPGSPAGEARQCYHMDRSGRSYTIRQTFRERLLACRWADVQRVAAQYLSNGQGHRAVIAPRGTEELAKQLGLSAIDF